MSMFSALDQRQRSGSELEPFNPAGQYFQALADVKVNSFLPDGMSWGDACQNRNLNMFSSNNAMLNILPPTLPERSSFVRRPRSLTEQSDLSEMSVEDLADRSSAALRENEAAPEAAPEASMSKAEKRKKELDDLDALLAELGPASAPTATDGNGGQNAGSGKGGASNETDSAVAAFLGGNAAASTGKKKKKKKGKKKSAGGGGAAPGEKGPLKSPADVKALLASKKKGAGSKKKGKKR